MSFLEALLWLSLCVYHEARGEPQLGQQAVADVVLNRADNRGLSVREVVLQPSQFSWTHQIEPNEWTPRDAEAAVSCIKSSFKALLEGDTTKGSTHYHNSSVTPYWTGTMELRLVVGSHRFYR